MDILTVPEVRSRLPFKISERELRKKLRGFGRIILHRNQIALASNLYPDFLDWFAKCSGSSNYVEVEIWREGWDDSELVDPRALPQNTNVHNLWWRAAGPLRG